MKPLKLPCSYCKNNKKGSNCTFSSSSSSAKSSSKTKTKIRSCGNTNEVTKLHRFSIERLIKRASLFAIVAVEDNPNSCFKNVCRIVTLPSLVKGIKGDNGIVCEDEGGGKGCRRNEK